MEEVKKLNIKSVYHYFKDIVNIEDFHSNLLDINIYYIGYITIKKFGDCENIHSVNPLYLIMSSTTRHFKEKYGERYLIIDSTEKHEEVFSEINSEIEALNDTKELFYEKDYARIGVNTDDNLPLNKQLKFPTLIIIIRCVFPEGKKLYPEIYLDKCLYDL